MPSSYLALLFLLSSCELFTLGSGAETGHLIKINETDYQKQIEAINACLESEGETGLTEEEKQRLLTDMQRVDGGICASYTVGVIEHPRVRRCKYGLFGLDEINDCLQKAKEHSVLFKERRTDICKKVKQELAELDDTTLAERNVTSSPVFHKIKNMDCGNESVENGG